jgi:hypothetical protein
VGGRWSPTREASPPPPAAPLRPPHSSVSSRRVRCPLGAPGPPPPGQTLQTRPGCSRNRSSADCYNRRGGFARQAPRRDSGQRTRERGQRSKESGGAPWWQRTGRMLHTHRAHTAAVRGVAGSARAHGAHTAAAAPRSPDVPGPCWPGAMCSALSVLLHRGGGAPWWQRCAGAPRLRGGGGARTVEERRPRNTTQT